MRQDPRPQVPPIDLTAGVMHSSELPSVFLPLADHPVRAIYVSVR